MEKVLAQQEQLLVAAQILGQALASNQWLYAFGTGHSHLIAEEIFYRAGGLARACPILDERFMLHKDAIQATYNEREEGRARQILNNYKVEAGDVMVVISNSGRNAVPIEMALESRKMGAKVISITNFSQGKAWPSRHSSGLKLDQVADIALDNCGIEGDAVLNFPGLPGRIGPTSTSTGAMILNLIIVQAQAIATELGNPPEIYISSNTSGDDHNEKLLQKYKDKIPHL